MSEEKKLIRACRKGAPKAQRILYERYAPFLLGVIRRYISSFEDAEDVMSEAIFKVLTRIDTYDFNGSFEGWVRRIGVNEALMFIRKVRNAFRVDSLDEHPFPMVDDSVDIDGPLSPSHLLELLDQLPEGYRTIFNLYVMDGYKHREIGEMLNISIHTSKSQLIMAKKKLKALIEEDSTFQKNNNPSNNNNRNYV